MSLWLPPAREVILEKVKLPENPGLGCVMSSVRPRSYSTLSSNLCVVVWEREVQKKKELPSWHSDEGLKKDSYPAIDWLLPVTLHRLVESREIRLF